MTQKNQTVTIAGGGPVGTLLGIILAKRGYTVDIYERRTDMRKAKISAGKSINLALSDRGWRGIELAGIAEDIRKVAIPMLGRMIHNLDGTLVFQPYGTKGEAINSVSRGGLNIALLDLAEAHPNITLHFNHRCLDVDYDAHETYFLNEETGEKIGIKSDIIIGADGAFSAIRAKMQKLDRFNYSQTYIEQGYKELTIPATPGGGWKIEKHALHIWPRGSYMLIALPNTDGSFTCTLFFPFEGNPSFDSLKTEEDVLSFFKTTFPDALALIPTLAHDFFANPTSSLVTVRCYPWIKNRIALIGDAAHAICPFYGQGMNCGFEDAVVLDQCLDRADDNWEKALEEYQVLRKPNADAIAQLALDNFVEMRDKVADKKFILRKKIEVHLAKLFPNQFIPLYTMVTFLPDSPYADALKASYRQDALFEKILAIDNIEERWKMSDLDETYRELMKTY